MAPRGTKLGVCNSLSEPIFDTKCATINYFRFATAILETNHTQLGQAQTVAIHGENTSDTPSFSSEDHFRSVAATVKRWLKLIGLALNSHNPSRKHVGEYQMSHGQVGWGWSSRFRRFAQNHSRRRISDRLPMCGTWIFDEIRLCEVWLVDYKRFQMWNVFQRVEFEGMGPMWRQQTGSGLPDRSPMCPTVEVD